MNRAERRRAAAQFRQWKTLLRIVQRWADISDATMAQFVKDGSVVSLVHDAHKAGKLSLHERSVVLTRLDVPKKVSA